MGGKLDALGGGIRPLVKLARQELNGKNPLALLYLGQDCPWGSEKMLVLAISKSSAEISSTS